MNVQLTKQTKPILLFTLAVALLGGVSYGGWMLWQSGQSAPSIDSQLVSEDTVVLYSIRYGLNSSTTLVGLSLDGSKVFEHLLAPSRVEQISGLGDSKFGFVVHDEPDSAEFHCFDDLSKEDVLVHKTSNIPRIVGWFDEGTLAYTTETDDVRSQNLILVKGGSASVLAKIPIEPSPGRGGSVYDSTSIKFSPRGNKLLYINTHSAGPSVVYVYNLDGVLLDKILGATHPVWLDNSSVLFRRVGNDACQESLCFYDLDSKVTSNISSHADALSPTPCSNKVAYWVKGGFFYDDYEGSSVWLTDLNTGENTKVLEDATNPVWVSEDILIVSYYRKCARGEVCPESPTLLSLKFGEASSGVNPKGIPLSPFTTNVTTICENCRFFYVDSPRSACMNWMSDN